MLVSYILYILRMRKLHEQVYHSTYRLLRNDVLGRRSLGAGGLLHGQGVGVPGGLLSGFLFLGGLEPVAEHCEREYVSELIRMEIGIVIVRSGGCWRFRELRMERWKKKKKGRRGKREAYFISTP